MSSRDRSDQPRIPRRSTNQTGRSSQQDSSTGDSWDVDPAEIDRYLSGRPQRSNDEPRRRVGVRRSATPSGGAAPSSNTADQISQLRNMVSRDRPSGGDRPAPPVRPTSGRQNFTRSNTPAATPAPYDDVTLSEEPVRSRADEARTSRERLLRSDPFANDIVVQSNEDAYAAYDDEYDDDYDDADDYAEERPSRVRGPRRQLTAPSMPKLSIPALPSFSVPPRVAQAAILDDIVSLSLIGIGVVSLAIMSIVVANRVDSLSSPFATHVSASGIAEHFRTRGAIWGLPILGVFILLMNIVIATFTARMDRFASRFVLGAGLVVQVVAWVAIFRLLW